MRSAFHASEKDLNEVNLTLTISMNVGDWRSLIKEQSQHWPSSDFISHIETAISHIELALNKITEPKELPL